MIDRLNIQASLSILEKIFVCAIMLIVVSLCINVFFRVCPSLETKIGKACYDAGYYTIAKHALSQATIHGDRGAHYYLGLLYTKETAAAKNGTLGEGNFWLAQSYEYGSAPDEKNMTKAFVHYKKVADDPNEVDAKKRAIAIHKVASMYISGEGTGVDGIQAVKYLKILDCLEPTAEDAFALKGYIASARQQIGDLYERGIIVPLNLEAAQAWHKKAGDNASLASNKKAGELVNSDTLEANVKGLDCVLLGVSLVFVACLRPWITLCIISQLAAHHPIENVVQTSYFSWIGAEPAITILMALALLEIILDLSNNLWSSTMYLIRPLVAATALFSVMRFADPILNLGTALASCMFVGRPFSNYLQSIIVPHQIHQVEKVRLTRNTKNLARSATVGNTIPVSISQDIICAILAVLSFYNSSIALAVIFVFILCLFLLKKRLYSELESSMVFSPELVKAKLELQKNTASEVTTWATQPIPTASPDGAADDAPGPQAPPPPSIGAQAATAASHPAIKLNRAIPLAQRVAARQRANGNAPNEAPDQPHLSAKQSNASVTQRAHSSLASAIAARAEAGNRLSTELRQRSARPPESRN